MKRLIAVLFLLAVSFNVLAHGSGHCHGDSQRCHKK